jgi:DNA-binding response OmpR family regulator
MANDTPATVLIVEDENELREILADTLNEKGYHTLQAANGKEGLDTALREHPDIIMLDILMPVMGGMETLRELRKDSWGKHVPVMILTNLSANDEDLIQDMIEQKPICYIIKSSWEMQNIVDKLEEILKAQKK